MDSKLDLWKRGLSPSLGKEITFTGSYLLTALCQVLNLPGHLTVTQPYGGFITHCSTEEHTAYEKVMH